MPGGEACGSRFRPAASDQTLLGAGRSLVSAENRAFACSLGTHAGDRPTNLAVVAAGDPLVAGCAPAARGLASARPRTPSMTAATMKADDQLGRIHTKETEGKGAHW